jgi:amino acid adenylation domain-containing protein/non-ribosomal peptide synthase protein (TIGR01720 family)
MSKKDLIEDIYPLSPMQQGMLFHTLYAPRSGVYIEQTICTLQGQLDVVAFARAWQRVLERHTILRTAFSWEQRDEPFQVVYRRANIPWEHHDWRGLASADQQERLDVVLQSDRERSFDLAKVPLMRLALIQRAEDVYSFVWSYHHLLLDGWSLPIILKEIFTFYDAFCRGQDRALERPRPYGDYIAWLQAQDLSGAEAFWRRMLAGFQVPTPLGVDRMSDNAPGHGARYAEQQVCLLATTALALQTLARQHMLTMNTLVQGAWALLLSRYSGEEDILFGTTVSGRAMELAGAESMVGVFINTLPLRVQVPPGMPLPIWLRQLQAQQVELRRYEYSPLLAVQGWSEIARGLALFESIVVFENYPVEVGTQPNTYSRLAISDVRGVEQSNYPLTLGVVPGSPFVLKLAYDERRFDATAIFRMLGHVHTLLGGMLAAAEQSLGNLPLLTAAERQQCLVEWNTTQVPYPHDRCLPELFEAQVSRTPAAIAVIDAADHVTYAVLNARADQLAHDLRRRGVGPEVPVGLCLHRSLELVVGLLGILKAGGAWVPLDPRHPSERLAFLLEDAQVAVLVTDQRLRTQIPSHSAQLVCLDRSSVAYQAAEYVAPRRAHRPDALAALIYTSGSTGTPKAVQIEQHNLVNVLFASRQQFGFHAGDVLPWMAPVGFDITLFELFTPLLAGGRVVVLAHEDILDLARLLAMLDQITVFHAVPSLMQLLVQAIRASEEVARRYDHIRLVLTGGEAVPPLLLAALREVFRRAQVCVLYGPTEATIICTRYTAPCDGTISGHPIGTPLPNVQVRVYDVQRRLVPIGLVGELYIGGAGVTRGYHNQPDLSSEKFLLIDGQRWYRTGDLARWRPDGGLEFVGRRDEQVKLRGYRIELGEVETVLGSHPAVNGVAVLAREDAPGDRRLVAYVVMTKDERRTTNDAESDPSCVLRPASFVSELRTFLSEKLPDYMLPAAFVLLDALPLTANGKLDRKALPAPNDTRLDQAGAYVAPRTPVEELLAQIWSSVLHVELVGAADNFFALGGHSLRATQIIARIRKVFQVELPLRDLFEAPTLAELAERIIAAQRETPEAPVPPLTPRTRGEPIPLSFAQQRLWFLDQLQPQSPAYNLPSAVRLTGLLHIAAVQHSLDRLVARHEALRTCFPTLDGQPIQQIAPPKQVALPLLDLSALRVAEREPYALGLATAEAQRPFDLAAGPLLRAVLLRLAPDQHVLLLTLHHIITDAWSMRILIDDLVTVYRATTTGSQRPLAALPIQYADYTLWQRQWLQGAQLEQRLAYWRRQLAGLPLLDLPTDHPRPAIFSAEGAIHEFLIPAALRAALVALSRQERMTLFMLLLAAWQVLLARYSGQRDIVVGTPIANRTLAETEPLIGFFVNTLVLRSDLGGNPTFRAFAQRVRSVALAAYAHQDVPFERLVDALAPARDLSRQPLFQVMFALQNAPVATLELPELVFRPLAVEQRSAMIDLGLSFTETPGGLAATLTYRTTLFDPPTIIRMAHQIQVLLAGCIADPARPLADLPLLSAAARQQLLVEWNATRAAPADGAFHDPLAAPTARTPDAVALVYADQHLTYRALDQRATQLAQYLAGLSIGPEVVVAVCMERSLELVIALLGVLKAGGAFLPLDPAYPHERLRFMLDDAQARVLLTVTTDDGRMQPVVVHRSSSVGQVVDLRADWPRIAEGPARCLPRSAAPDQLAYLIYTSGATGTPKGVLAERRNLHNTLCAAQQIFALQPDDALPWLASPAFDIALLELFLPLCAGACVRVLAPAQVYDLPRLIEQLDYCTRFHAVPDLLRLILETLASRPSSRRSYTHIRTVFVGGDVVPPRLLAALPAAFPRAMVQVLYGPTEATIICTHCALAPGQRLAHTLIGRPLPTVQLRLYDCWQQLVPLGVPGELYIGGAQVTRGYLHQAALTQERFVVIAGQRWYQSGDRARYRPDGRLEFLGRIDDQVKLRGFRIELGEIETVLSQHPTVRECVVAVRPDARGDQRLVAYVVPQPTQVPGLSELRAFLQARLPEYMLPAQWLIVAALPLTPNGKVDRNALPAPDAARPGLEQGYVAPRTELERLLAGMWQELLGVTAVGVDDNFFELGGNSIQAAMFTNRLQALAEVVVYVVAVFDAPTVAELAIYLAERYPQVVAALCPSAALPAPGKQHTPRASQPVEQVGAAHLAHFRRIIPPLPPRAAHEQAGQNRPVVFVLSPPRSGSTLLRVMLAGHPQLFAPPELELLSFNTLVERRDAFAGRNRFWLEGTVRAIMAIKGCDALRAEQIMAACEAQQLTVKEFYRWLQQGIGDRMLVDKSPSYTLDSATLQRAEADFAQPAYIHLLRHPYGMIRSFEEAQLDQVFFRYTHPFPLRMLAELIWLAGHQNIREFLRTIPPQRQYQIRFEELVAQPQRTLEGVCQFLGLEWHPDMLEPYQEPQRRMTDGIHALSKMVGDVKFHQHWAIDPAASERWRQEYRQDFLGEITWELAEALSYERIAPARPDAPPTATALTAIPRLPRAERSRLPLSFAQQRLWFLDQLQPGSPAYTIPTGMHLTGPLNVAALEQSLCAIIDRHESLRTTFVMAEGQPAQVIAAAQPVCVPCIDLRALPADERAVQAQRLVQIEAQRPFDLAAGPLLRTILLRLAPDRHLLLLTLHHIIADAWSMRILIDDLMTVYRANTTGPQHPLAALPIQYADYAVWQRQWLQGARLEQQLAYWRRQLAGLPLLDLPNDHPRPAIPSLRGAAHPFVLPMSLSADLLALSRQERMTLFMLLLAAWQVLLARYSGQRDIVVGTPIANRTLAETEPLIGFFVNTLVLRSDLGGNPTFRAFAQRVRSVALAAYAHQDVPFERLVDALAPARDLSRQPLFQVLFALQNVPRAHVELPGLTLHPLELTSETAKFELSLVCGETPLGLTGALEYHTDIFEATTIARMQRHFQALLASIVAAPTQRWTDLALLSATERQQLLVEWNATDTAYPQASVHELFEAQIERMPDGVAVVYEDAHLTYRELNMRANRLAHSLQQRGVRAELRVGLCLERSLELVIGLLGILKAGGAYVPLDPAYPKERLAFMLADAQVRVLITAADHGTTEPRSHGATAIDTLRGARATLDLRADWPVIAQASAENPISGGTPDSLAYLIYTSGSTGTPKGVSISHRSIVRLVQAANYVELNDAQIVLQLAPISFDAATFEIWGSLLNGARLVVFPAHLPALAELGQALERSRITTLWLTAGLFHHIVETQLDTLRQVDQLLVGGDVLSVAHIQQAVRELNRCTVINGYGPTENTTFTCCYPMTDSCQPSASVPIGRPIANTRVYVLDRQLQSVPVGVPGELYAGGDGLARCYHNQPALTAERFVPNPFTTTNDARRTTNDASAARAGVRRPASSVRLYRTGDVVRYRADGALEFLGRLDEQVKVRGYRIELGEVETVIGQHALVRECVVIARADETSGKRLVAYVVPAETLDDAPSALDEPERSSSFVTELRGFLAARLPAYMLPSAFVLLAELPLTIHGKVDRRALPAPETSRPASEDSFVAPRSAVEILLADIWAKVLRLDRVGIHDNFFALGGDSILSIQIVARVTQAGVHLTPKQLFQHQTIAELAAIASSASTTTAEQGIVEGPIPLTPIQRWFFARALPDPHHFNLALLLMVLQPLQVGLFAQALHHLCMYHDALRLRFVHTGAGWQQINAGAQRSPSILRVDLTALPLAQRGAVLEATAYALQASLDLTHGLIMRVALFDYGADQPGRLLLVIHHLAVDGVSWRILLEDMQTVYTQLCRGEAVQLPPKTTSFRHWAERLLAYAHTEAVRQECTYWLAGPRREVAALPTDYAAGSNTVASARSVVIALDVEETRDLLQRVPLVYQTQINDVLLTALAQAYVEWTGIPLLLVDLEGHGREEVFADVDLTRTVGWHTTIYPLLLDLRQAAGPGAALKAIKEQLRAVPQRGIGYGLLRYLSADDELIAQLAALPQAEVGFNYLGQVDAAAGGATLFGPAPESSGASQSPRGLRSHLLEISGVIAGERLQLVWTYGEQLYRRATMERLAQGYLRALRAIIAHCLTPASGGYTPSDFPEARLSQKELDKFVAKMSRSGRR